MWFPMINKRLGAATRCAWAILFCVMGLTFWNCSQSSGPLVIINVDLSEVPDVARLVVNSSLNERSLEQKEYTEDFATFGLRLPGGSEGEFRISIEGQRADMTRIAIGNGGPIAVSGQNTFQVSVKLQPAPRSPLKLRGISALLGNHLNTVWGTSAGDIWVGGEKETLWHRAGLAGSWVERRVDPLKAGDTIESFTVKGIWGTSPMNMWAVGQFVNSSCVPSSADMGSPSCTTSTYHAAYSTGGNWQLIRASSYVASLTSVRGTSSTRVFAGGRYEGALVCPAIFTLTKEMVSIDRYADGLCRSSSSPQIIRALWVDQTRVWGAGYAYSGRLGSYTGVLYASEGSSLWQEGPGMNVADLNGIWSSGDGSGWIVGLDATILRKTLSLNEDMGEASWQPSPNPAEGALNAVWGFSNNDVWAVGAKGTVLHFGDNGVWEKVPQPQQIPEDLKAVWGSRPDDVWIVGNGGTVYHYP